MILTVVLLPLAAGFSIWLGMSDPDDDGRGRAAIAMAGVLALVVTVFLAVYAAAVEATGSLQWGPMLQPGIAATGAARVAAVLVAVVAVPVVLYAAFSEEARGLARLVGLLVVFVGAMELTVLAGDLLSLLFGWELMSVISWALIAHHWRSAANPGAAAHAFNTTRFGSLGLFLACGAALASAGSLEYSLLPQTSGSARTLLVAGVLVAAVTKSAQVPFSPWLYSAMAGPVPVSALLHSATMVAAGAYLLVRLHPVLELEQWFAPVTIAIGLATALAGGVAAALQSHIKKTLAASTSAQFGLMFVAVGAGYPAAALAHLVMHAVLKAQLFLAAGSAIAAAGTEELRLMRLGRALPAVARLSLVGALALAAVPPLGASWSKEMVTAAAGHRSGWLAAAVAAAGALSALYAWRFHRLAFGGSANRPVARTASKPALIAIGSLAAATVASSVLWFEAASAPAAGLTGLELPSGKPWELAMSVTGVAFGLYAAWVFERRRRLDRLGIARAGAFAGWFGVPAVAERTVVNPTLRLAGMAAVFDRAAVDGGIELAGRAGRVVSRLASRLTEVTLDHIVDSVAPLGYGLSRWLALTADRSVDLAAEGPARATGRLSRWFVLTAERRVDGTVEGLARATGAAGGDARKLQTGMLHQYYLIVAAGLAVLVISAVLWR